MKTPQLNPKQREKLVAILFIAGLTFWTLTFLTSLSNC